MPSPIGHALAGVATAWSAERLPGAWQAYERISANRLTLVCAVLAVLPDVDLLYMPIHRTVTHSLTAVAFVMIISALVTGRVTRRPNSRVVLVCAVAYASHVLLDWLGADANPPHGIQALWPFSHRWFISPWVLFPGTERRDPLAMRAIIINATALLAEVAILGPVVLALWIGRARRATRTRKTRGPTSDRGDRRQPSAAAEDTAGT